MDRRRAAVRWSQSVGPDWAWTELMQWAWKALSIGMVIPRKWEHLILLLLSLSSSLLFYSPPGHHQPAVRWTRSLQKALDGRSSLSKYAWQAVARPGLTFALEHQKRRPSVQKSWQFLNKYFFQCLMHAEQCLEPMANIISFNSHNPSTRKLLLSCFYSWADWGGTEGWFQGHIVSKQQELEF